MENMTLYEGETWPITENIWNKISNVELGYIQLNLQISKQGKYTTSIKSKEIDTKSSVTENLENRTSRLYGNIKRMAAYRWLWEILEWIQSDKSRSWRSTTKWETHLQWIMNKREIWTMKTGTSAVCGPWKGLTCRRKWIERRKKNA